LSLRALSAGLDGIADRRNLSQGSNRAERVGHVGRVIVEALIEQLGVRHGLCIEWVTPGDL
jgi:hypothetical protein